VCGCLGAGRSSAFAGANGFFGFLGFGIFGHEPKGLEGFLAMLLNRMPTERPAGFEAGLEIYDLAASDSISDGFVESRLRALNVMLTTDPQSVFNFVPLPATSANGLGISIVIRDDLGRHLARAANDFDLSHTTSPADAGDPAGLS